MRFGRLLRDARPGRWLVAAGVAAVVLAAGAWVGWRAMPYVPPAGQVQHPASVTAELQYVQRYWQHPNAVYGTLGGTDCVDFTSQALLARGWTMDLGWGTSVFLGRRTWSRSWTSSTAMMRWLATRPDLAVQLTDAQRSQVQVGDIVQFDWDASGDRDHTAIVTRVLGHRIEVGMHSPAALHADVDTLLAEHGGRGIVHYWHLRS